jgi:hypothetical protein
MKTTSTNILFQWATSIRVLARQIILAKVTIRGTLTVLLADMNACRTGTTLTISLVDTSITLMGVTAIITGP